jgi:hypothetical protein
MIKANDAKVEWNADKKHWQVVITMGSEVIRRHCEKTPRDAPEAALRELAVATAKDEGYELDPGSISVEAA